MRAVTLILLAAAAVATAINPLVIKGSKWFDSVTGNQFYVVGVAYAPANAQNGDPLSDINGLNRDIPNFKDLGINAIRVYSANPSLNHDQGMQLLADAGIYVMLDISSPEVGGSIDPKNPQWNTGTFGTYKSKIDAFLGYTNVLGFIAGNEVVNSYADTKAAAFVKASIRDSKAYIKSRGASIPVGYAATDIPANEGLQLYLDCISRDSSVDFYGINTYRWCGNNNFDQSYSYFENLFKNYDAPLLFTEYGCNDVTPRPFNDVGGIYSSRGAAFLSGGFVYEYTNEANNYGLVQINGNGLTKLQDYTNFKSAVAAINPPRTTLSAYTGNTNNVDTCPAVSTNFLSSSAALPPTPDSNTCGCLFNTLSCVIDTTDVTKIQGAVGYACSQISCADIDADSYNGVYGRYSGCSDVQKSSYVLSLYYAQNGPSQGSGACTFNGVAKVVTPSNAGCSAVTLPSATPTRNTVFTAATSSTTSQNVQTSASAAQTSAAQTAVAATSSAAVNPTSAVISEVTSATAAGTGVNRQQGSTTSLIPMMLVVVAALVALF